MLAHTGRPLSSYWGRLLGPLALLGRPVFAQRAQNSTLTVKGTTKMTEIIARNVNIAFAHALSILPLNSDIRQSRNGPVMAFKEPVTTVYTSPTERVLFSAKRNANPVFHLMESLWMLAGRNDLKFPGTFVKNMANFSDDGKTLWGAYGFRWRQFFGYDQLDWIADELRFNPSSRRCVLAMWNGWDDSQQMEGGGEPSDLYIGTHGGKDVPCNTHAYFDLRDGRLNMTVCCRSNDIMWGCYGANAVHFSVLLEYMAVKVGAPVGVYRQMSNDLHLYTDVFKVEELVEYAMEGFKQNHYQTGIVPLPLIEEGESVMMFDNDVTNLFHGFDSPGGIDSIIARGGAFNTEFFNSTVMPMLKAWRARKNFDGAPRLAEKIAAPDWSLATKNWLLRNQK